MPKFPGTTIDLSDTVDQWGRKVHINVRNGKVTLVHRWRSRADDRKHTQRTTLTDEQAGRLLGAVAIAAAVAVGEDNARRLVVNKSFGETSLALAAQSDYE